MCLQRRFNNSYLVVLYLLAWEMVRCLYQEENSRFISHFPTQFYEIWQTWKYGNKLVTRQKNIVMEYSTCIILFCALGADFHWLCQQAFPSCSNCFFIMDCTSSKSEVRGRYIRHHLIYDTSLPMVTISKLHLFIQGRSSCRLTSVAIVSLSESH